MSYFFNSAILYKIICRNHTHTNYFDILPISKHEGTFGANFIVKEKLELPDQFWTPFYGLVASFCIPSIINRTLVRRNKKFDNRQNEIQRLTFIEHKRAIDV